MNKDYLFERTGSDGEIERLENVLSAYRFEPGRPPTLPENSPAARFWSFGWLRFSLAAGAVAVAVITGLLAHGRIEKLLDRNVGGPEISDQVRPVFTESSSEVNTVRMPGRNETKLGDSSSFRKVQPVPQRVVYSRPRVTPRLLSNSKPPVTLTKQEKYAYDQLRVALYITGSKLKTVQDTIDRVDDKKADDTRNEK